jgi:isoleucyl-tRNA synthetase
MLAAYDAYDYGTIFRLINSFTTIDLSAFYADVSKDRLYTFAARSPERRSAQTAMYLMADGLTRLMAPILSFTADELWRHLPRAAGREASVHIAVFPAREELQDLADPSMLEPWARLIAVRDRVLGEIEPRRKNKEIGSSLQARVVLTAGGEPLAFLQQYARALPMLFIVSEVDVRSAAEGSPGEIAIAVERAAGVRCERCWRYVDKVSSDPATAGLCERCQGAVAEQPVHP